MYNSKMCNIERGLSANLPEYNQVETCLYCPYRPLSRLSISSSAYRDLHLENTTAIRRDLFKLPVSALFITVFVYSLFICFCSLR